MSNETVTLKGKGKWARLVQPDTMYNKWSIVLYPDTASLETIKGLQKEGIKNKLKMDDDGLNMNFSRPTIKKNFKTGRDMPFLPPLVTNKEGQPFDGMRLGNGSDVTIVLEVYSHAVPGSQRGAKAARLKSVRVDNLVPFEPQSDYPPHEVETAKELRDQPETTF